MKPAQDGSIPVSDEQDSPYKTWEVSVTLDEVIDGDLEAFLDLLAERVGNALLMDITYRVLRVEGDDTLILEVCGDDSERENV